MKRRRSLFIHLSHIRLLAQKFAMVFLFLFAFILMMLNKAENVVFEKTSSFAMDIATPLLDVVVLPAKAVSFVYDYFVDLKHIRRDNINLKEENEKLHELYNKARMSEIENKLLSDLMNYITPPEADFVTTRVIAEEGDAFSNSIIAYVGDSDVETGQVALSEKGVIGRVDEVGNVYAKVVLLTDITSKIPVVIERSRVRGILAGDNTPSPKLIFTPLDSELLIGDRIVTSGVAGAFPAGLPVGKIVSINKNEVTVKPFGRLEQLEYIKIVDYNIAEVIDVPISDEEL